MAIEIYDKATIVKKGDKYYYLLKYGSKNCFTNGGQYVIDNNFHDKYLSKSARDSHWSVVAVGNDDDFINDRIANTFWNCPTSSVYGLIRFGNYKNIAYYWVKMRKAGTYKLYDSMDNLQKRNIDKLIAYAEGNGKDWVIDLSNIPDTKKFKATHNYCGTDCHLTFNCKSYNGIMFWDLNNL